MLFPLWLCISLLEREPEVLLSVGKVNDAETTLFGSISVGGKLVWKLLAWGALNF